VGAIDACTNGELGTYTWILGNRSDTSLCDTSFVRNTSSSILDSIGFGNYFWLRQSGNSRKFQVALFSSGEFSGQTYGLAVESCVVCASPSPTPSITPSVTRTPSISVSRTPSVTPSITPSVTRTPSVTPSPSGTSDITVNYIAAVSCGTATWAFYKNLDTMASGGGEGDGTFTCVVGDVLTAEQTSGIKGIGCDSAQAAIDRNGTQVAFDSQSGFNVSATAIYTVTAGTTSIYMYAGNIA
jgi:hypothetical protein